MPAALTSPLACEPMMDAPTPLLEPTRPPTPLNALLLLAAVLVTVPLADELEITPRLLTPTRPPSESFALATLPLALELVMVATMLPLAALLLLPTRPPTLMRSVPLAFLPVAVT